MNDLEIFHFLHWPAFDHEIYHTMVENLFIKCAIEEDVWNQQFQPHDL